MWTVQIYSNGFEIAMLEFHTREEARGYARFWRDENYGGEKHTSRVVRSVEFN